MTHARTRGVHRGGAACEITVLLTYHDNRVFMLRRARVLSLSVTPSSVSTFTYVHARQPPSTTNVSSLVIFMRSPYVSYLLPQRRRGIDVAAK